MKKKVLVGLFLAESNANIPSISNIADFDIAFGDECIKRIEIEDIFDPEKFEVIPTISADQASGGVVDFETFHYFESVILEKVREYSNQLDGIYMHLHGASEVVGIGSGDHHILYEIRKIVGPYLPIFISCDPHGNLCKEYVDQCTYLRSFRESPHTDSRDTKRLVANKLVEFLEDRQNIHAIYRKLPMILGGEQSVSTDEPVASINKYMDEMEKDPRVRSASWHVGYIRHDSDVAGCSIVVVPQTEADMTYCEEKADELAKYVWDKRHEFHYTGFTALPEEALQKTLEYPESPCIITDSGDNVTSGSSGWNTYVLKQVLAVKDLKKSFLFATICDPDCYNILKDLPDGTETTIDLGVGYDYLSEKVHLDVTVIGRGPLNGNMNRDWNQAFGYHVLVRVKGTKVDIMVASNNQMMIELHQFVDANVDIVNDYDVTVVKQGYIFPDLKDIAKFYVMSLTEGATLQNTAALKFKRIMRPMFPIDNI